MSAGAVSAARAALRVFFWLDGGYFLSLGYMIASMDKNVRFFELTPYSEFVLDTVASG